MRLFGYQTLPQEKITNTFENPISHLSSNISKLIDKDSNPKILYLLTDSKYLIISQPGKDFQKLFKTMRIFNPL